jgi:hypothetical protein
MLNVMPSQVVQTIDELFPHAARNVGNATLAAASSSQLLGILKLVQSIPDTLVNVSSANYADLVLATSTIEEHLKIWRSRGNVGDMTHIKGRDAVTIIRQVLALCPDEHPPPSTTELNFIDDPHLGESIRRDVGAANRALNGAEWKAATVLAGAAVEALLLWRLQQKPPGLDAIENAVVDLVADNTFTKKPSDCMDRWDLHHYIEVAVQLDLIKPDTASAARLARNFRNLIHPGRAARLAQNCDRATAYTAIGALEHVIRDLG